MTRQEAFIAMVHFLEHFYEQTASDDVGALLGDMILVDEEKTMDPAAWNDWIAAIEKMRREMQ